MLLSLFLHIQLRTTEKLGSWEYNYGSITRNQQPLIIKYHYCVHILNYEAWMWLIVAGAMGVLRGNDCPNKLFSPQSTKFQYFIL